MSPMLHTSTPGRSGTSIQPDGTPFWEVLTRADEVFERVAAHGAERVRRLG